jgi:hypothetical protein
MRDQARAEDGRVGLRPILPLPPTLDEEGADQWVCVEMVANQACMTGRA